MNNDIITFVNGKIFDGSTVLQDHIARVEGGRLQVIAPASDQQPRGHVVDLAGDILSPGYVDLQLNGGGGVMFNDDPSVATLRTIAMAHRRLGVAAMLPTLITDTAEKSQAAIKAVKDAIDEGVPGIVGLHLEGPHLSVARKGAHDAALIRPMEASDLKMLLDAARSLPHLMITVAPENVTLDQVRILAEAGVLVSLGHSDADHDTCLRYFAAGARAVTHLFNAMSQMGNREPGVVGAAVSTPGVTAGLIADAIHVHPSTMKTAWAAKLGTGGIYLVSDAMAVAGTDLSMFELEGRPIHRNGNRLTLSDGTLAGADLDLTTALRVLIEQVGVPLDQALFAAIAAPAALIGAADLAVLKPGRALSSMIRIASDLSSVTSDL